MKAWTGKLSRIEAIRILDRATDKDDAEWCAAAEDHYDEAEDTQPSLFDVFAALGITEAEYREASGEVNVSWPPSQPAVASLPTAPSTEGE